MKEQVKPILPFVNSFKASALSPSSMRNFAIASDNFESPAVPVGYMFPWNPTYRMPGLELLFWSLRSPMIPLTSNPEKTVLAKAS